MKKADLAETHRIDLATFVQRLAAAGWEVERWDELMDAGADVSPQAAATYSGGVFDFRLEYHASGRFVRWEMEEPDGDLMLALQMYPALGLAPLLERVIAIQNIIDADNMTDVVKSLVPLCDPLLIDTDDGLRRIDVT